MEPSPTQGKKLSRRRKSEGGTLVMLMSSFFSVPCRKSLIFTWMSFKKCYKHPVVQRFHVQWCGEHFADMVSQ
ncbi:hypothetical protein PAXRUDRAFT_791543 [Paxillus rubicundulus Ve08.2h10]|uniref:Unplaced genomic scaffold scaffold_423, whole genome shotgun sequence n=1 Tax=Paxillus rubicundulus Ve08.2h10 TaxID=930991 RepID=A0A0D0DUK4_9AGAM|nr:hypothetical protein PAXRUDRAFT_791543 [Paxillus rubicundulus Ve08.2h10]